MTALVFLLLPSAWITPPQSVTEPTPGLRSPMIFKDGSTVQSPVDWAARRKEILAQWHEFMGPWPEVIESPKVEVFEKTNREGIQQERVRVQVAREQELDGYLLTPSGPGPFPAVFVPFYDPETSVGLSQKPSRDFAMQLAKRGFVALALGSPGGDARKPVLSPEARCQPLSYLGYVAANAWRALASRSNVDAKRIGIVGHSYGGKWAMFGSCLYEKYACAVWSDPGIVFDESRASINYQEPWYLGLHEGSPRLPGLVRPESPRTGAYKRMIDAGINLHELHVLMAPRPFLVSGGAEDPPKRWSDLVWAVRVNALLGYHDRVAMTNRELHEPNVESNEQICQFFEHWLKTPVGGAQSN